MQSSSVTQYSMHDKRAVCQSISCSSCQSCGQRVVAMVQHQAMAQDFENRLEVVCTRCNSLVKVVIVLTNECTCSAR
jgi:DNA-directed RNA polymerase subunit M/transcription elongation factor TFIIS